MPASLIWLALTLLTIAYARNKACFLVIGITCGVALFQGMDQLNPVSWALIDFCALIGASYLWHKNQDYAALIVGGFLAIRILWHALSNGIDLHSYYLGANLMYGMMLLGVAGWKYYYSRQ